MGRRVTQAVAALFLLIALPRPAAADRSDPTTTAAQTLLDRPLFSATRRPAPPSAPPAPAPAALAPRLTGIVVDRGDRHAIFAAGDRPVVATEGGRVGPFTVRRIEARQVTITGPAGTQILRTSFDSHPPAPRLEAPARGMAP